MYPHEFKLLWLLGQHGPLAAAALADSLASGREGMYDRTATGVANQLRRAHQLGLITTDGGQPAIYRLTPDGQEYVDA